MIKTFITATLETLTNRLLQLDPQTINHLQKFSGKIILIRITDWKINLYALITAQGIKFLNAFDGEPDATICGSSLALLRASKSQTTQFEDIIIEGNIELGQQMRDLIRNLDIDWEEQLAKVTGDVIAHQVGKTTTKFFNWLKQSTNSLQQDFTDYLQLETRILPERAEIAEFIENVSDVRNAAERLEAKINLLTKNL